MSVELASEALHARVRAVIDAFAMGREAPEAFDALACDLARFQAEHVPGYARLCASRGVDPKRLEQGGRAPAVPVDAFRASRVFAFDERVARFAFRTSGTTTGARGVHFMRDASTYDAAALAFGRAMLARGLTNPRVLVLGPSAVEAKDSSLAHMCALFGRARGLGHADSSHYVADGVLQLDALRRGVASLTSAAIVLATSFALVHLVDALAGVRLALPRGSRVMQTGGFKGRSRAVAAVELRSAIARTFVVDDRDVVGEYGMTELSSQFWEATAVDPGARPGVYVEPPWARVVPVDPETLEPVAEGEVGIARIEDLANVDSAFAIVTQDRTRRVEGGFELLGRAAGAPPRGCSIALDEMLSAASGAR